MTTPLTRVQRRRRRPARRWRRTLPPLLIAGGVVAAVGAIVAIGLPHGSPPARQTVARSTLPAAATARSRRRLGLVERPTGSLVEPVQDAAAVALDGRRAMLLGGLTATDASRRDIRITTPGDHAAGQLPTALHDTAAARLGRTVYLFGGGTGSNTQSDEVVRVSAAGGAATVVGRLPSPSSDQSAAVIGGTVYVVGGYTGSRWLDTIVAWRPGAAARIAAHLPFPLRYAAVAAVGTRLVIAGGSLENGAASDRVLEYTPPSRRVIRIGRLPSPTTHAAAAALGEVAYVIGGRGAAVDAATARIVAVDPQAKRVRAAGSLARPRSDLAAVTLGNLILLAGGRGASRTQAGLSELVRDPARHAGRPTRKAIPEPPPATSTPSTAGTD
jgi:Kelch motif